MGGSGRLPFTGLRVNCTRLTGYWMCGLLRRSRRAGLESGILAGYGTIRLTYFRKKTNGLWKQNSRADRQKTAEERKFSSAVRLFCQLCRHKITKHCRIRHFTLIICYSGIIIYLMLSIEDNFMAYYGICGLNNKTKFG